MKFLLTLNETELLFCNVHLHLKMALVFRPIAMKLDGKQKECVYHRE